MAALIDYAALVEGLSASSEPLGLLTQQASPLAELLHRRLEAGRLKALFSAEHGFYGAAAAGEHTASSWHSGYNVPIHSLYGETRVPTDAMLEGLGRVVVDLRDIGVRCYTYLATLGNMLSECARRSLPVTVLDAPVPLGGILDGPLMESEFESFVCPLDVPLCHSMTIGECAEYWRRQRCPELQLTVVKVRGYSHLDRSPWLNFYPPSPAIRSFDSAALYPLTVFTEAYPAVDCDRAGTLAFRVLGAPWLDAGGLLTALSPGLGSCGVAARPCRYVPQGGPYAGLPLDGLLFEVANPAAYYPVTAGVLVLTALLQRHGARVLAKARPDWLNRLTGSTVIIDTLDHGSLSELFQGWIADQDAFLARRVDLYERER